MQGKAISVCGVNGSVLRLVHVVHHTILAVLDVGIQLEQLPDELDSYTEDEAQRVVHVESVSNCCAQPIRLHGAAVHKLVQADPAAWSLVRISFNRQRCIKA